MEWTDVWLLVLDLTMSHIEMVLIHSLRSLTDLCLDVIAIYKGRFGLALHQDFSRHYLSSFLAIIRINHGLCCIDKLLSL